MKFRKKRVKIAMIVALLLVILIPLIVMVVSKHFTAQEQAIRDKMCIRDRCMKCMAEC